MRNYTDDLKIDQYNLDDELIKQAQIFMEWASLYARASIDRETAKNKLDIIKAKEESLVRTNMKTKLTEPAIQSKVIQKARVKKYTKKYLAALYEEKILNEAKTALKAKQKMLEGLVQLRIQSYYSDPKVKISNELFDTVNHQKRLNSDNMKKKINKQLKNRRKK